MMRLAGLRCVLATVAITLLLAGEVRLTYEWQQRFDYHVVNLALALGALLPPSLYFTTALAYKFCNPRTNFLPTTTFLGFGVISSFLGIVGIACFMSTTSAWCCVREGRRLQLCELAAAVAKVFNQNGLDYHVTFGTLLGVARIQEGAWKAEEAGEKSGDETGEVKSKISGLIPWEHDLDIAIAEKQANIAYKLLKKRGFNLERRSPDGTVAFRVHLPESNVWAAAWAMTWIDVYPFVVEKATGAIISKNRKNYYYRPLISDVKPYRNISFCGFDSFSAPRLPLRYVKKKYGPNWRKPEFPDNYRNNTCRLFKDC